VKRNEKMRVLVAMSGGVDSSVAAMLLVEAGFCVVGVSMNLFTCNRIAASSCCSPLDRRDAAEVCRELGIEHHVLDCRREFSEEVIAPFVSEYLKGRTPSPCISCNERIKFRILLNRASFFGADVIATGHYARIEYDGGVYHLAKGSDELKDQSYFLYMLGQSELSRILFPVGGLSKKEVRKLANERGIATCEKPESQEICFIPDGDYAAFVETRAGAVLKGPGDFVDAQGRVLGRHSGIHAYTIGQRRGLGFGIGKRQYVVAIDPLKNEVVLGSGDMLMKKGMLISKVCWTMEKHKKGGRADVKIRSMDRGTPAKIMPEGEGLVKVVFDRPVRAVAPGQVAVFYEGNEVLGGGFIERAFDD
jgi:tRNA-specific 2-thiouridylase